MTMNDLKKEHTEKWRKENPTKYMVWLICYIGDMIPIVIGVTQLMGPLNDKKVGTMLVCLAAIAVLSVISMVISLERGKDWKAYLEANRNRLK